jgi:hypothetical protein
MIGWWPTPYTALRHSVNGVLSRGCENQRPAVPVATIVLATSLIRKQLHSLGHDGFACESSPASQKPAGIPFTHRKLASTEDHYW